MAPTLPLLSDWPLRNAMAPSRSAMAWASGTENMVLNTWSITVGSGEPSRVYMSGATAR